MDAYTLAGAGDGPFDGGFAGCWWSHVPLARLAGWLDAFHARLDSGAQVVMLDNGFVQTSSTPITRRDADGNTYQRRTLDDDSVHEVLKNFPTREQALELLGPRAVEPAWVEYEHYWTYARVPPLLSHPRRCSEPCRAWRSSTTSSALSSRHSPSARPPRSSGP